MWKFFSFATCFLILVIGAGCKQEENLNADGAVKFENIPWKLLRYGMIEEQLQDFPTNKLSTLYFNAETKIVKGSLLCNSFESPYTRTQSSISIFYIATTEIYCGEDTQGLASFIMTSLSSINRYEVDGSRLIIHTLESGVLEYGKD